MFKNRNKKILAALLAGVMALSSLTLSGCNFRLGTQEKTTSVTDTAETESGKTELSTNETANPTRTDLSPIVVTDSVSDDISKAASKGLMCGVSVVCNYTTKVHLGGFYGGSTQDYSYSSAGAGVIYQLDKETGSAFFITNYHVVYDSNSDTATHISDDIHVYLYGQESSVYAIPATYVGGSVYYDIAILYVENSEILKNSDAMAVTIADSDTVAIGQKAIAVGNPEAEGLSVTQGVVSVDSEYITMTASDNSGNVSFRVMRIDTAVNSGNSGGGLYDAAGNLIGIVNAKTADTSVENIGYAIPSNVVVAIAQNILDYCVGTDKTTVYRCILGITVQTNASKAIYDSKTGLVRKVETVSVATVSSGTLADGKLKVGDVLKSITIGETTKAITRQYQIIDAMLDVRVGDTVILTVERDGVETQISLPITASCLTAY